MQASTIVDLIVIAIFATFMIIGFKKGFVSTFFSLSTFFITIILVFLLYAPLSSFVASSIIGEKIGDGVKSIVYKNSSSAVTITDIEKEQKTQNNLNDFFDIIPSMKDSIVKSGEKAVTEVTGTVKESIVTSLTGLAINLFCIVALLIGIWFLLGLLKGILNTIAKLPLIGFVNRVLGGAVGLLNGAIIIYLALWIILLMSPLGNLGEIGKYIQSSNLAKNMYENNIIVSFLK